MTSQSDQSSSGLVGHVDEAPRQRQRLVAHLVGDVDGRAVVAAQRRHGRAQQLVGRLGLLLLGLEALAPLAQLLVGEHAEDGRHRVGGAAPVLGLARRAPRGQRRGARPHDRRGDVVAGAEPEHAGERERGHRDGEVAGVARVDEAGAREHHAGRPRLAGGAGAGGHGGHAGGLRGGEDRREPPLAGAGHRADGLLVARYDHRALVRVLGGARLVDLRLVDRRQPGRGERREDRGPGALRHGREHLEDRRERRVLAVGPQACAGVAGGLGEAARRVVPAVLVDDALRRLEEGLGRVGHVHELPSYALSLVT